LLAAPGHAYNLSAPGEISTGEVGKFQPAKWGNFNRRKLGNIQPALTDLEREELRNVQQYRPKIDLIELA